jgi:alanine racemase
VAYITISKENYFYNLEQISKRVASVEQIAVVLKDNAYGHGIDIIAPLAKEFGISRAVVRSVEEAKRIEKLFPYILILAPERVEKRENFFYTINQINDIYKYQKGVNIELKVDSGMHRLGVSPLELYFALNLIKSKGLRLRGFFTHLREADELSSTTYTQLELFNKLKKDIVESCFNEIHTHSRNSAGVFRSGSVIKDEIVRVGIASYGYVRGDKALKFPKLKPVLSLFGEKVGTLARAGKSFRVGYGGISKIGNERNISIYDIGYGDGFKRVPDEVIESGLFQTPDGFKLFGKVSMDSIAINSAKRELKIFNDVSNLAKLLKTIEYEVVVSLSSRIRREVI